MHERTRVSLCPRHIPTALGNTWVVDVAPPQGGRYMAETKVYNQSGDAPQIWAKEVFIRIPDRHSKNTPENEAIILANLSQIKKRASLKIDPYEE